MFCLTLQHFYHQDIFNGYFSFMNLNYFVPCPTFELNMNTDIFFLIVIFHRYLFPYFTIRGFRTVQKEAGYKYRIVTELAIILFF